MWAAGYHIPPKESRTLQYWASRRGIMPFSELLNEFPREHRLVHFAYVQSFSIVTHLINRKGGLERILRLLSLYQHESLSRAWEKTYGERPEDSWEIWRREEAGKHNLVIFIFGEIPLFSYLAVLFLLAYARYRVKRRRYFKGEMERETAEEAGEGC